MDHIAFNQDNRANSARKIGYFLTKRPDINLVLSRLRNRRARADIRSFLEQAFPGETVRGELHPVEHHLAHLSSAFHVCPFDQAAVVSVDGFGDFSSAAWGSAAGCEISTYGRVYFPHSLGIFYQAITQYLGFPHYGDEYKVMGLAPYGRPSFLDAMRKIVRLLPDGGFELDLRFFRHHREDIAYQWADGSPGIRRFVFARARGAAGAAASADRPARGSPSRHRPLGPGDVRGGILSSSRRICTKRSGLTDLALAGGCAMNSVANGKVRRMTPFRRVYVQAAAGDAGGAIGAAFAVWHKLGGKRSFRDGPCLLGAGVRCCGHRAAPRQRIGPNFLPPVARSRRFPTKRRYADAPLRQSPRARSSAGFRDGWNGDRARSATARSSAIRAAPI